MIDTKIEAQSFDDLANGWRIVARKPVRSDEWEWTFRGADLMAYLKARDLGRVLQVQQLDPKTRDATLFARKAPDRANAGALMGGLGRRGHVGRLQAHPNAKRAS